MKSSLIKRLILFVTATPFVLSVIYFLPHYQNFGFMLIAFAFAFISIVELHRMLNIRGKTYPLFLTLIIALVIPLLSFLYAHTYITLQLGIVVFSLFILGIFILEFIFSFDGHFEHSLPRVVSGLFTTLYPGLFFSFLFLIASFPYSNEILLIFLGMVFLCDSGAWLFGMLFGKSNRGIVPASPKKSIMGFIGGLLSSNLIGILGYYFFPNSFKTSLINICIVATLTGLAAIIGDLFESVLKRSINVKDSGTIVMGRGGALDSIDSILFALPVFYLLYKLLIF